MQIEKQHTDLKVDENMLLVLNSSPMAFDFRFKFQ
jgi:hypothetical protein